MHTSTTAVVCLFSTRTGSVVRPMRRCQSDLGYVSQETVNSDFSSSSFHPRAGVRKKLASGVCTTNRMPRANRVANRSIKLLAKVSDFLKIYISQCTVATHLRCGGVFSNKCYCNCIQNVPVKQF